MIDPEGGEYVVYRCVDPTAPSCGRMMPRGGLRHSGRRGFAQISPWRIYTTGDGDLFVQVAEDETRRNRALWQTGCNRRPLASHSVVSLIIYSPGSARPRAPEELGTEFSARIQQTSRLCRQSPPWNWCRCVAIDALLTRLRLAFEAEGLAANGCSLNCLAGNLARRRLVELRATLHSRAPSGFVKPATVGTPGCQASRTGPRRFRAARLAEPIDLLPAARILLGALELGSRLTLRIAPDARLMAKMDIDAFGIVVRNLLNADKHGTVDGPISVFDRRQRSGSHQYRQVVPTDRLAARPALQRGVATSPDLGWVRHRRQSVEQVGGRFERMSRPPVSSTASLQG